MKVTRIFATSLMFFITLSALAATVPNQDPNSGGSGNPNSGGSPGQSTLQANIPNPLGDNTNLIDVFNSILDNLILPLGATLAVLAFIWSGFMFVTAQGNPTKIQTARLALLYTAVGTAILLGARLLGLVIANTIQSL